MQPQDKQDFNKAWSLVFQYFNPDRRDLDTDCDLFFRFMPKQYTIEEVRLGVVYVIQHNKYYPMISEFTDAMDWAVIEEENRRRIEESRAVNEEYQKQKQAEFEAWDGLSPEEKTAKEEAFKKAVNQLWNSLNPSEAK